MLENAYELKMTVMKNKYDRVFEEFGFSGYNDDRMVAVNELNQILAACEVMKGVKNPFVCTAVNQAIKAQDREMESIVRRFTGRVYKGVQWIPFDDVVCDEAPGITKEMIRKGLEQKVIALAVDPNLFCGTVCTIGEDWFYFGDMVAEESDAEEYLRNTPIEDIVDEIFAVLDYFKTDEDFRTEYAYYAHYLKENLRKQKESKEQEVQTGITADMLDQEFAWLKGYAEQACLGEEPCGDIFRMLWTAYCCHANRIVDTEPYDRDIRALWDVVSESEEETANWSDFDSFDLFMCKYLV